MCYYYLVKRNIRQNCPKNREVSCMIKRDRYLNRIPNLFILKGTN